MRPRPITEPFEISETREDARVRLRIKGDLDHASAPELAQRIHGLRSAGHCKLELDLTQLGYFDSTGLAVLMGARRKFLGEHESLVLRGASGQLRKVLDITGLALSFAFAEAAP